LKKKFKIKTEEAVFKVRKDTILLRYLLWEYFAWMLPDLPLMLKLVSDFRTVISRSFGNGWLNAVHDDDKQLLMVGKMKPLMKKCQNIVSCALTAKLWSWDSLFE
jgi:hypothetical protein